ncbi:MAG: alpha/beta fold hydrolase [Pseudomonadota bacterium]|uniref:alpha/beta fold hydrolase n=1 Tax=Roseovarius sp. TaxID=1486281 RepID=UPI003567270F
MLNRIEYGTRGEGPGLLIAHGLYGSARNWGVISKRLSDSRQVVAVDMRNHGSSPWFETHSYPDMANDLAAVLEDLEGPFDVLGHSMGGKAAMVLALTRPELVNRLIVADIAPVTYSHSQIQYIEAMKSVDLSRIESRSDVNAQLEGKVDNPALINFFTQSIDIKTKKWRLNLETLGSEMPGIMSFPDISGHYDGKVMFLTGADSDYVTRDSRPKIKDLFPKAQFVKIPGAGHWLHADRPRAFEAAVREWLS